MESDLSPYGGTIAVGISLACTVVAIMISSWHITMHLRNYTEPTYQRYIVRIIFMVPVYATMSFGALAYSQYAMYFNTIRDVYEAWVIYNFMSLCLSWVGGPGAVVTSLSGRLLKPSCLLMTCFLPPIPLDGRFIRKCKQGCLQFVFLKPLLATTCLVLYSKGLYSDGDFSLTSSYVYITCIYMASYTVAIYALILFYVACKDLLHSFNPIPKFLMIKAVVFLTYWQGVLIFTVGEVGLVPGGAEDAADLQNVLICVEMALGAVGFFYAFPYQPFMPSNMGAPPTAISSDGTTEHTGLTNSIKHAIDLHDVVSDTVHQFASTYHDYVLYSDGTEHNSEDNPNRFRGGRTLDRMESSGDEKSMTSRESSLLTDPSLPNDLSAPSANPLQSDLGASPVKQPQAFNHSPEGAELAPVRKTLSVGGASLVVRLPPPPEDTRTKHGSLGFNGSAGGGGGAARGSSSTNSSSGVSSQRSSATDAETTVLKKGGRSPAGTAGGAHLDLLVDEDDLVADDPVREGLEGFVQR